MKSSVLWNNVLSRGKTHIQLEQSSRRWKWFHVATFPERRWAWGCYREHGARHWRNTLLKRCKMPLENSRREWFKCSLIYLSVCLCCNSCAFRRLFHRGFLFSSGFGDLCSHAFGATKEPNRSNDWTKTASFLPKIQFKRRHLLLQLKPANKPETKMTANGRVRTRKMHQKKQKKREFLQFFFLEESL